MAEGDVVVMVMMVVWMWSSFVSDNVEVSSQI